MYKLTNFEGCVIRLTDNRNIPSNTSNIDYQEYLEWLSKGNTPEPSDPEPKPFYYILRRDAYKTEADDLFFQEQRGEVPVGTWEAKIQEIRKRYPKD